MMVYHPSLKPLSYIGILSHLGKIEDNPYLSLLSLSSLIHYSMKMDYSMNSSKGGSSKCMLK
jgi:hypothetical protein